MENKVHEFMQIVSSKNAGETEFLQAVEEVAEVIIPFMQKHPKYNIVKLIDWELSSDDI